MKLLPADILLYSSAGFIPAAINECSRSPGEAKGKISHVSIVSFGHYNHQSAMVVESLWDGTKKREIKVPFESSVAVYRNTDLSDIDRVEIAKKAESYIGRKYGYLAILGHAMDYLTGGGYKYRRLLGSDNYPICSWVVAHAYKAIGYKFLELEPGLVQPDDIADAMDVRAGWELVGTL